MPAKSECPRLLFGDQKGQGRRVLSQKMPCPQNRDKWGGEWGEKNRKSKAILGPNKRGKKKRKKEKLEVSGNGESPEKGQRRKETDQKGCGGDPNKTSQKEGENCRVVKN